MSRYDETLVEAFVADFLTSANPHRTLAGLIQPASIAACHEAIRRYAIRLLADFTETSDGTTAGHEPGVLPQGMTFHIGELGEAFQAGAGEGARYLRHRQADPDEIDRLIQRSTDAYVKLVVLRRIDAATKAAARPKPRPEWTMISEWDRREWAPKGPYRFVRDGDEDDSWYLVIGPETRSETFEYSEAGANDASCYVAWLNKQHAATTTPTESPAP